MTEFVPGLDLAHAFYEDVLAGIVGPVSHAAAALGEGSEMLGFDTARSTDHSWGPRAQIFVQAEAVDTVRSRIDAHLPDTFQGWPVSYYRWQTNRVEHHVEVTTVHEWFQTHLGVDPRPSLTTSAWLATPQQLLLEVTRGRVFHDDTGDVTALRARLGWYPADVWLWMMAAQWNRLQEVESFIGRTAELGDQLGSRLVAARIAQDAVRLCFLQERQYVPYPKWLGTAFARLDAATEVGPLIQEIFAAADFAGRDEVIARLYEALARRHNALSLTAPVDTMVGPFEVQIDDAVRPFRVLNATRFVEACRESVADEALRRLPVVGAFDQLTAPTDLLVHFTDWPRRLDTVYHGHLDPASGMADDKAR